ncbi:hypothetical protein [Kitasatospora cineracea]|uniref:Uncharacterized protein n=1 Tax=Kitasatospora cineracea TaxID=88074 RepID=A0A3N4R9C1_9ACTN|nr:hypothetical protein [Kitasatospora cineracea]RPE27211.1 hypothetical protein EDD38_7355 [Kitasatospora cineracea]
MRLPLHGRRANRGQLPTPTPRPRRHPDPHQRRHPGPWYPQPDYGNDFIATQIGGYEHGIGWLNFGAGSQARADREFVTAARTDVPALLAYARHLEARAASLEAERDGWAENSRNEARIWTARVAELEQQLAQAQAEQHQYYTALQGVARNSPPARDGR